MGGANPYMDLNANYEKHYYDVLLRLIQIRICMGAAPGVIHTGVFCPNSIVSGWKN
jgi:hypothetical protein